MKLKIFYALLKKAQVETLTFYLRIWFFSEGRKQQIKVCSGKVARMHELMTQKKVNPNGLTFVSFKISFIGSA